MDVQKSLDINAPPEKIWPLLSQPEKIRQWYTPVERFEYTTEQRGVGAPFRFVEHVAFGKMDLECVITEWVEAQVVAFRMTSGNFMKSYAERWTVEPTATGSTFTFTEQGEMPFGVLGKLITPIAERGSGATIAKMLASLKSLAEA